MKLCKWCRHIRNKRNNGFHSKCKGNKCECNCRGYDTRPPYPEMHVLPFNVKPNCIN